VLFGIRCVICSTNGGYVICEVDEGCGWLVVA
jgi:hypothetical protein